MKFKRLLIALFAMTSGSVAQNLPGSIELRECRGCEDIIEWPTVSYPAYLGYGPHKFQGEVGIRILIDKHGIVISAKAIFGHPTFRPMLEMKALQAKFKAANTEFKREATFIFRVTPLGKRANLPAKGVINGRALILPKPVYSDELKELCASGEVKLAVRVSESGSVLEAEAISGDELLHDLSISAVKQAKFEPLHGPPIRYGGIVVYNFPSERSCVDVGNVNGKWVARPEFSIHAHAVLKQSILIRIRVGIDVHSGQVIASRAVNGHPLIRASLEKQTLDIKFSPTLVNSEPLIAKGVILMRIHPNRTVELKGAMLHQNP